MTKATTKNINSSPRLGGAKKTRPVVTKAARKTTNTIGKKSSKVETKKKTSSKTTDKKIKPETSKKAQTARKNRKKGSDNEPVDDEEDEGEQPAPGKKRVVLPVTKVAIPKIMAFESRKNSGQVIGDYLSSNNNEQVLVDNGSYSRVTEGKQRDLLHRSTNNRHGMITAMVNAFSNHYPLVLRPQQIWIMILQGVSDHVNSNAAELQSKWMAGGKDSKGGIQKKKLTINSPSFVLGERNRSNGPRTGKNDWASVVCNPDDGSMHANTFLGQIKLNIHRDAYADLLMDEEVDRGLSDTTPIERVCMGITVMTALQSYFSYCMTTTCGFPYIVLEGEKTDWMKIRKSAERLVRERCTSHFSGKWLPALLPLLDKFVEQYEQGHRLTQRGMKGKSSIDSVFWNAMVKRGGTRGSGAMTWLTGWINILFPYISEGKSLNCYAFDPYSSSRAYVRAVDNDYSESARASRGTDIKQFSRGLSKVPVEWNYLGRKMNLEFNSGFVTANQDPDTKEISAELMWFITEKGASKKSGSR